MLSIYNIKRTEEIFYECAELAVFNHLGLPTYCRYKNGDEVYAKYNDAGKMTCYDLKGKEKIYKVWYDYDWKNNRVRLIDSKGFFERSEYDENNNLIFSENPNDRIWIEYDDHNNPIHGETLSGLYETCKYNEDGKLIYHTFGSIHEHSNHGDHEVTIEYNKYGSVTHSVVKNTDGSIFEDWNIYGGDGKLKVHKDSSGAEERYIYDSNGNVTQIIGNDYTHIFKYSNDKKIYSEHSDGTREWFEYDKNGNLTYLKTFKDNEWYEEYYEYDENGHNVLFRNSLGTKITRIFDKDNNCIHTITNEHGDIEIIYRDYNSRRVIMSQHIIHSGNYGINYVTENETKFMEDDKS